MRAREAVASRAGWGRAKVAMAIAAAAAVAAVLPHLARAGDDPGAVPVAAPAGPGVPGAAMAAVYGIRVDRVAVTGGGGLVDLRFTVVDPEKARTLLEAHARPPRLLVEGSDVQLEAPRHGAMRATRLQKDATSFLLFPNTRSAVRPGKRVAVVFGDVRVEPVVVQ